MIDGDSKKQRRAKNADRNLWVALDFHTRTGRHREKLMEKDWAGSGLKARQLAMIASRIGARPEFIDTMERLRQTKGNIRPILEGIRPQFCKAKKST